MSAQEEVRSPLRAQNVTQMRKNPSLRKEDEELPEKKIRIEEFDDIFRKHFKKNTELVHIEPRPESEGKKIDASKKATIYVDEAHKNRGFVVTGMVDANLRCLTDHGFRQLMISRPEERGELKIAGKVIPVPRYQKAYLKDYHFTGMNHHAEPAVIPEVQELLDFANRQRHLWFEEGEAKEELPKFNSALINWYLGSDQYIGFHSDQTTHLEPGSPIFCASFGAPRTFILSDKFKFTRKFLEMETRHGSYVVMCGDTQDHFAHSVPKSRVPVGPRISVTFRMMREI